MAKPGKPNKNRTRKRNTKRSISRRRREAFRKANSITSNTEHCVSSTSSSLWNQDLGLSGKLDLTPPECSSVSAVQVGDDNYEEGVLTAADKDIPEVEHHDILPTGICETPQRKTSELPCTAISPLYYETERVTIPKEPASRRVLCDLLYLIEQARQLENHSYDCSGRLYCQKIQHLGMVTKIHYQCNKSGCSEKRVISTEKKFSGVNNLAVLGALATGSGYSQEDEKFATLDVKYMSQTLFSKCERVAGEVIDSYTEEMTIKAIEEERKLAEKGGSVNNEGYACIAAIVDGGWCKRSYGHGYNASSGVAVIIGAATHKIIFIGVRNKLCLICNAIASGKIKQKDHICFKNWSAASTAMEPHIIVEGLNYLDKVHKVRCNKLVGDGDSSTMSAVRERVSFGRTVQKVECANHAVRRYCRALERLSKDTSRFCGKIGILGRKILSARIPRLAIGARSAIKNHAAPFHKIPSPEMIENFKKELRNGPNHVFGRHINCGGWCNRKQNDPDGDVFEKVEACGLISAVEKTVNQILVSDSNTLIFNATNNPAEHYMSQLAKTCGGKRVDHSRAGGIIRRSQIAALAYQDRGQGWHSGLHKELLGKSPTTPLRSFILKRKRVHERQLSSRKLFQEGTNKRCFKKPRVAPGGDKNYGNNPAVPDISPEELKEQSNHFISKLAVKRRDEHEQATVGQADNSRWREERSNRLSSTKFKRVVSRKSYTPTKNLIMEILYSNDKRHGKPNSKTAAMQHGTENEPLALAKYREVCGHTETVTTCGLFIDPDYPYLCTSPDAVVGVHGLVEIKCPFAALKFPTIAETASKHNIGLKISKPNNQLILPESHSYFFQIQGQLAITDRKWCDLFVWSSSDHVRIRIFRNKEFWARIRPILSSFYLEALLPEIIDPRVIRGLPLRELDFVKKAIEEKARQKETEKAV